MTDDSSARRDLSEHDDALSSASGQALSDLLCFSHLRWDFVFQRPQHLMSRFARQRRVFYIEEPIFEDIDVGTMRVSRREGGLHVVTPLLPHRIHAGHDEALRALLDGWMRTAGIQRYGAWYYTPMALAFSEHLQPQFIAYDCMDELRNFKGAPSAMEMMERRLLERADVVFTGGQTLYEAKRDLHHNILPLPSSIDRKHFAQARQPLADPDDQRAIAHPRLGFFGVIDERFDIDLVAAVAQRRPDWQIVLVGPVVKIDPEQLPRLPNIHYLGMKSYAQLPAYLAGWDVAIMPFARNDATRFISPTKTPEYLAGGRPVVSTSITDVVHPYADLGLVRIADTPDAFVDACEAAMRDATPTWLANVDAYLARNSWDFTWQRMQSMLDLATLQRSSRSDATTADRLLTATPT